MDPTTAIEYGPPTPEEVGDGFAALAGEPGHSLPPAGSGHAMIETEGDFARPIAKDTGRVRAEARVAEQGRQIVSPEAKALSRGGKALAHGTSTVMALAGAK